MIAGAQNCIWTSSCFRHSLSEHGAEMQYADSDQDLVTTGATLHPDAHSSVNDGRARINTVTAILSNAAARLASNVRIGQRMIKVTQFPPRVSTRQDSTRPLKVTRNNRILVLGAYRVDDNPDSSSILKTQVIQYPSSAEDGSDLVDF